jgi:hypothetical protein
LLQSEKRLFLGEHGNVKDIPRIVKEIETNYPVDTIVVNGEQVWPYMRMAYYFWHVHKVASEWGAQFPFPPFATRLMQMVKNSLYGFKSWFGKYDYIALSDTSERKNINGRYFNKLLDPIIDALGQDKVLYIENPAPSLYPARKVHTKNIVCLDFLTLLALILMVPKMFIRTKDMIQNRAILETIQKEYGSGLNYVKETKFFNARRRGFSLLFGRIKPGALLLSGYYSYIPAVKAAKDLGIKVIEFQHGAIGKEHSAYNVHIRIDKSYFPDYLLVFGRGDIKTFDNSRFIEPENVYPVGSFYIEHVRKNHKLDASLLERIRNYRLSVGITLDWMTEKQAIEFICQAANLDKATFYILIPRVPQEQHYTTLNLPDNVMVIKDKNFYEVAMYVDFHATVISSCALEAPSLGVQNIFINIDNLSKQYYGDILKDKRLTRYADTPKEFVEIINTFEKLDRDIICRLNEDIIATGYEENLHKFIERHLK